MGNAQLNLKHLGEKSLMVTNKSRVVIYAAAMMNPDWEVVAMKADLYEAVFSQLIPIIGEVKDAETVSEITNVLKDCKNADQFATAAFKAAQAALRSPEALKSIENAVKGIGAAKQMQKIISTVYTSVGFHEISPGETKNMLTQDIDMHNPFNVLNIEKWAANFGADVASLAVSSPQHLIEYDMEGIYTDTQAIFEEVVQFYGIEGGSITVPKLIPDGAFMMSGTLGPTSPGPVKPPPGLPTLPGFRFVDPNTTGAGPVMVPGMDDPKFKDMLEAGSHDLDNLTINIGKIEQDSTQDVLMVGGSTNRRMPNVRQLAQRMRHAIRFRQSTSTTPLENIDVTDMSVGDDEFIVTSVVPSVPMRRQNQVEFENFDHLEELVERPKIGQLIDANGSKKLTRASDLPGYVPPPKGNFPSVDEFKDSVDTMTCRRVLEGRKGVPMTKEERSAFRREAIKDAYDPNGGGLLTGSDAEVMLRLQGSVAYIGSVLP